MPNIPNWKKIISLFGGDYLSKHGILGKDKWTITGEKLSMNEELGYICHYITISNGRGKEYDLMIPGRVYDPKWNYDELTEKLSKSLNQTKETVKKRLGQVGMIYNLWSVFHKRK